MLKKMRWRFILSAMAAFFAVMLILMAVINLWNYSITTGRQDHKIENILHFGGIAGEPEPKKGRPMPGAPDMPAPEAEFTTRFFVVFCDLEWTPYSVFTDHIASISEEEAILYGKAVLSKRRLKGYYKTYRYQVFQNENGNTVIFLNSAMEQQFMKTLFLISCVVAFASLSVVFALVVFFSKYAIRPYAKNIERQKRFITDASHEIKTPLTSIVTSADVIAMEYGENEWIQNIQKQTMRLGKLVESLVMLSRLDEEAPFPEKMHFSFSDAVWETAEPFVGLAEANEKQFTQAIEEQVTLYGDPLSIRQLVSILLDNAMKYSVENGWIHLEVYRKHNKACLEVSNACDLGELSDIQHLFDRFYRPDASRSSQTGGMGIGLSIAQAIVEAHGGKIIVKSPDKKTIRFRVVFG